MDFPENVDDSKRVQSFGGAFTTSDDNDALDLMKKAADLPLIKVKFHNS